MKRWLGMIGLTLLVSATLSLSPALLGVGVITPMGCGGPISADFPKDCVG